MSSLDVVVGGQFGSEAKGHVTKRVIERRLAEGTGRVVNVRVAGPNAGHCVLDARGTKFAFRSLPVGVVFPNVDLVIAAGSEIDLPVLLGEIDLAENEGHRVGPRLRVHPEATVLTSAHKDLETGMRERMGSTGKGIGAARADRIMRTAKRVIDDARTIGALQERGVVIADVTAKDGPFFREQPIVIEGTQGYGLGLHAGHYPQCTSSNTRAIDFCAMAGYNPWSYNRFTPWVVARVYPIRVAGNSGPLRNESTWEEMGLPVELTTVTKLERRVGGWDADLVHDAVWANGPEHVKVALTMVDQKFPHLANVDGFGAIQNDQEVIDFLRGMEKDVSPAKIELITTGEDTGIWLSGERAL